jgi:hypothetical protein
VSKACDRPAGRFSAFLDSLIRQQSINRLNSGKLLLKEVTLRSKEVTSVFAWEEPIPNEKAKSFEVVSPEGMNRLLFQMRDQRKESLGWPVLEDFPDHLCCPCLIMRAEHLFDIRG